jgi:hypothetical protein
MNAESDYTDVKINWKNVENFADALKVLEEHRREPRSFDQIPVEGTPDYSEGLTALKVAVGTLSESIENGQHKRTVYAFAIAAAAVVDIYEWLEKKGYSVDATVDIQGATSNE